MVYTSFLEVWLWAIVMLIQSHRKGACGLPTPRPSTISSRLLVTSTKNHPTPRGHASYSWTRVLAGQRVSHLSRPGNKMHDYVLRRYTQTTKEGDDPCIRTHRSQGLVSLFYHLVQFRQPFSRPPFADDIRAEPCFAPSWLTSGTRPSSTQDRDKLRLSIYLVGSARQRWMRMLGIQG